jgi:uncharacterized protein YegL
MENELNVEFADNPDPRCPCVLLLDTSDSMRGNPIVELNAGLQTFQTDLQDDPLAARRVEVAIVTFGRGGVEKVQDFVTASSFTAPTLSEGNGTPMGEAINLALDMVAERKATYQQNDIAYYQPWIVMITDGAPNPTSPWQAAAQRVQQEMTAKKLTFFAVGVKGADMQVLAQITPRSILLDGLRFRDLFVWISQSQKRVSSNKPGDQTALPAVTFAAPVGG